MSTRSHPLCMTCATPSATPSAFASPVSRFPGTNISIARKSSRAPASPVMSSLLFFDVTDARARLLADPRIADATILKLYPDRLQITIDRAPAVRAVAERRPRQRDRRRRHRARAVRVAAVHPAADRSSDAAPKRAPRNFSRLLDRYPEIHDNVLRLDSGRRAALESAAEERPRRPAARSRHRGRTGRARRTRSRQEDS